jgi:O-antigen ligase
MLKAFFTISGVIGLSGTLFLSSILLLSFPEQTLIGLGVVILALYLILFTTHRLSYGLILWFLVVPFVSTMTRGAAMDIDRFLILLLLAFCFGNVLLGRSSLMPFGFVEVMMFVFCLVVLTSLQKYGNIDRYHLGIVLRMFAMPFLAYFLGKNLFTTEREVRIFIWALFGLGVYLSVTAFFEFFGIHSLVFPRSIVNADIGRHLGRARGPFLQAAVNGTAMGMILLASFYLLTRTISLGKWVLIMSCSGLMFLGVLFSLTRGPWVATAAGLFLACLFRRDIRRIAVVAAVVGVVLLPLTIGGTELEEPGESRIMERATSDTFFGRLRLWRAGIMMFLDHPLWGVGFLRFPEVSSDYLDDIEYVLLSDPNKSQEGLIAHNFYISIASELGLAGFVPFVVILMYLQGTSIRFYRALPLALAPTRSFIVMFWTVATVYLLSSFTYTQNSVFLSGLFFTFAGILERWRALFETARRYNSGGSSMDLPYEHKPSLAVRRFI